MTISEPISTLIVDNQQNSLPSIRTLLNLYTESGLLTFSVIGETGSIPQAIHLIHKYKPSLLILEIELNEGTGIDILKYLQHQNMTVKTLVLSESKTENLIFQAMKLGAKGCLLKSDLVDNLSDAVLTIMGDQVYFPPAVATTFFDYFTALSEPAWEHRIHLTKREKEVLQCLIEGFSNEEIAHYLYITVATVKAHLTAIFHKLGVKTRTQAIIAALKNSSGNHRLEVMRSHQ